jgi:hypothetical protein
VDTSTPANFVEPVFFALERLVDWWLVESPRPGRYQAVGLARAYAAELAGG